MAPGRLPALQRPQRQRDLPLVARGPGVGLPRYQGKRLNSPNDLVYRSDGALFFGVWVIAPDGKHLGTIQAPQLPANMAFGDADGRTLYLTARTGVYRLRLAHEGVRPPLASASR